jgi:signal transduction histidine kinase
MLISAAWIGPAILAGLDAYMQGKLGNRPRVDIWSLLWQSGDWLLYAALTPLVVWLARCLPLRGGQLRRNIPIHVLASLILCAAWAASGTALRWLLMPGATGAPTRGFLVSWFFTTLPFGVAVYFAVLGIEHATYYFVEAREREAQAARFAAQLSEARLSALRRQLNPHFLFNSLNAITVLVRDHDTGAATRMLEQLSEVLRHVLRTDQLHEIPLTEEIVFLEQYLAIEQTRFADRLRPAFDVDPRVLRAVVPTFLFQPLVENALQHGIARRAGAGLLRITARREGDELVLSVRDDGPGVATRHARRGHGVGLANTRERLATLYGDRGRLELMDTPEGGAEAVVRIPYRETDPRDRSPMHE